MHGGNIWAAARLTGRPPSDWTDFSASINPLGIPEWVQSAVRESIASSVHYPDPECFELTQALTNHYQLPDAKYLRVGGGAAELIHLLVRAAMPPAGLVVAPTFARYCAALQQIGTPVSELPAWPDPPNPADLTAWMERAPEGSVVFLCNPNNPTGLLLPQALLATALAQDRVWLVVDEAFLDFAPKGESLLRLVGRHPRLVVLRSLTKLYAIPGLRLGWMAGPAELIAAVGRLQVPWSVSTPAIAAGIAALTGPDYIKPTLPAVARAKEAMLAKLAQFEPWLSPLPTDCNYFLAELRQTSGTIIQERLLPHGILVRTCDGFSGLGDRYLRLAVRPAPEVDRLVRALQAL